MITVRLNEMSARALVSGRDPDPERLRRILPQAVRYYLDDRASGDPAWRYPGFLGVGDGGGEVWSVPLDPGLWEGLSGEAEQQDVPPDLLLRHAAFYFAAARDAGRLTGLIAERLRENEDDDNR
jgi:hypothetical protein